MAWNEFGQGKTPQAFRRWRHLSMTGDERRRLAEAMLARRVLAEGVLLSLDGKDVRDGAVASAHALCDASTARQPVKLGIGGGRASREAILAARDRLRSEVLELDEVVEKAMGYDMPLSRNDRSPKPDPRVVHLQNRLNSLGYRVQPDGVFGQVMEENVKDLQARAGLEPTGTVDAATRDVLRNGGRPSWTVNAPPSLVPGSKTPPGAPPAKGAEQVNSETGNSAAQTSPKDSQPQEKSSDGSKATTTSSTGKGVSVSVRLKESEEDPALTKLRAKLQEARAAAKAASDAGNIVETRAQLARARVFERHVHEVEEAIGPVKKGAFHAWLGKKPDEPITDADIAKGMASDDPHVRRMANFAKSARKWKPQEAALQEDWATWDAERKGSWRPSVGDHVQMYHTSLGRFEGHVRAVHPSGALDVEPKHEAMMHGSGTIRFGPEDVAAGRIGPVRDLQRRGFLPVLRGQGKAQAIPIARPGMGAPEYLQRAHARQLMASVLEERDFSQERREQLAKKGHALREGGKVVFPIENREDLDNAAGLWKSGHHQTPAAKAHIRRQAKRLGAPDPFGNVQEASGMLGDEMHLEVHHKDGRIHRKRVHSVGQAHKEAAQWRARGCKAFVRNAPAMEAEALEEMTAAGRASVAATRSSVARRWSAWHHRGGRDSRLIDAAARTAMTTKPVMVHMAVDPDFMGGKFEKPMSGSTSEQTARNFMGNRGQAILHLQVPQNHPILDVEQMGMFSQEHERVLPSGTNVVVDRRERRNGTTHIFGHASNWAKWDAEHRGIREADSKADFPQMQVPSECMVCGAPLRESGVCQRGHSARGLMEATHAQLRKDGLLQEDYNKRDRDAFVAGLRRQGYVERSGL